MSDVTATMVEHFVDNDGVRIRFLEWLPPGAAGAPIVFVPGFVDVADDYHEALVDLDRRVLVVELRGRGEATRRPRGTPPTRRRPMSRRSSVAPASNGSTS